MELGLLPQVLPTVLSGAEQGPGHCPRHPAQPCRRAIRVAHVEDVCQGIPYYCTHADSALFFSSAASPRMTAFPPQAGKMSTLGAGSSLGQTVTHSQGEESLYQGVKCPGRGTRMLGMGRGCNVPGGWELLHHPAPGPQPPLPCMTGIRAGMSCPFSLRTLVNPLLCSFPCRLSNWRRESLRACYHLHYPGGSSLPAPGSPGWAGAKCQGSAQR